MNTLNAWYDLYKGGYAPNVGRSGRSIRKVCSGILRAGGRRNEVGTAYYPAVNEDDKGGVSIGDASLWALNNKDEKKAAAIYYSFNGYFYCRTEAVSDQWEDFRCWERVIINRSQRLLRICLLTLAASYGIYVRRMGRLSERNGTGTGAVRDYTLEEMRKLSFHNHMEAYEGEKKIPGKTFFVKQGREKIIEKTSNRGDGRTLFIPSSFKSHVQKDTQYGWLFLIYRHLQGLHAYMSDFMKRYQESGLKIRVWTVNREKDMKNFIEAGLEATKSIDDYIHSFQKMGIMTDYSNFITASFATIQYLKKHYDGKLIYVMGTKSLLRELKRSKIRVTVDCMDPEIACVLVSYDNQLTYEKLQDTCQILSTREVGYIATNPDYVCPVESGYVPDCGAICQMIEHAVKRQPQFIGKPGGAMVEYFENESFFKRTDDDRR